MGTPTTGLTLSFVKALATAKSAPSKSVEIDVSRELGLELEETMYTNRLLALTNPGEYHKEREKKFTDLKTAASNAYKATLDTLLETGLPSENAKAMAMKAAINVRDTHRQILDFQFPANANIIGDAAMVRDANPYGGLVLPQTPRRAAARRRAPARRRRR